MKIEAKVKKQPVVPELKLPERKSESSIEKESSINNTESECKGDYKYNELLGYINKTLGFQVSCDAPLDTIKNHIAAFIERERLEKEDCLSYCNELKNSLQLERENHMNTKGKLKSSNEQIRKLNNENKIAKLKYEEIQEKYRKALEFSSITNEDDNTKLITELESRSKDLFDDYKHTTKDENLIHSSVYSTFKLHRINQRKLRYQSQKTLYISIERS